MARLFGTDGVRGVANEELTPELAFRLGFAGASVLTGSEGGRARVVIGRDTRISGDLLECALAAGLMSAGADVIKLDVIPTPGVAYLTRQLQADAGVMISASHNPVQDNGIKFFGADGFKLCDEVEDEIQAVIEAGFASDGTSPQGRPIGAEVGREISSPIGVESYIQFLQGTVKESFVGLRVVLDTANGAAFYVAQEVFRRLGADVITIHAEPNGANINVECGSTYPKVIQEAVLHYGAAIGLAFDGDADRLIAVDATGQIIDGDYIMAICGKALKERGSLANDTIVTTVMSNVGFVKAMRELGLILVQTAVGDRYVMEAMREGGHMLGGEQSGHVIFLEHNTTGDGVLTALQLVDIVVQSGKSLNELTQVMQSFPQVLVNVRVADKSEWRTNPAIAQIIAEVEELLGEDGRLLVRESGTEPLVRVMAEGQDEAQVRQYVERVASVIGRQLGVATV